MHHPLPSKLVSLSVAISCAVIVGSGCAAPEEATSVLDAEPEAGAFGERGPYGVTRASLDLTDNGRSVRARVYAPDDDGEFSPVVFVQGGFVPVDRYEWLGVHLASRGAIVAAPEHAFDLAFFSIDNAEISVRGLRALDERVGGPALVLGHSLGGVVAAKAWNQHPDEFRHLALLASFPDEADSFDERGEGRVVSVTGALDERSTTEEVRAGARAFDGPVVASVEGMNHYQWTDDATDGELDSDGTPTRDIDATRADGMFLVDALLADLQGEDASVLDESARWPGGLTPLDD